MTKMAQTNQITRQKQQWEVAIDKALEIVQMIDEDVSEEAWTQAEDFFDSIRNRCSDIIDTIERTRTVTGKQAKALIGWHNGVSAWIK